MGESFTEKKMIKNESVPKKGEENEAAKSAEGDETKSVIDKLNGLLRSKYLPESVKNTIRYLKKK